MAGAALIPLPDAPVLADVLDGRGQVVEFFVCGIGVGGDKDGFASSASGFKVITGTSISCDDSGGESFVIL